MRTARLLVMLLALVVCGLAQAEDWPTFRRDALRSGLATETLPLGSLTEAWATLLDTESVDSSPAVVGDRVYVGTATGKVCCLAADTGALLWQMRTGGAVMSSPAVSEGRVFVGSADRCLWALAADSGKEIWRVRTRGAVVASPLVAGGRVFCGSMDGTFRCLAAATGQTLWQTTESGAVSASAALADGVVYLGAESGGVVARQADDGKQLWSRSFRGGVVAAPCVAGERLLVPVMSATALSPPKTDCLAVCDRATGELVWSFARASSVVQTPLTDGTNVYFATVSGYLSETELFACRLSDGAPVWKTKLPAVADSSPLLSGGRLVFGLHDGNLHVVEASSGDEVAAVPLDTRVFSSPVLSGGRLFIGAQDGKLHCLK